MSHELRTPLNAIIGFSEALTERMFGDLNEKQDEYLKDIHASGVYPNAAFLGDLLTLAFGRAERSLHWTCRFWRRLPHPETGLEEHGPEADLTLQAAGWLFAVEAKWLSNISAGQGRDGDKTQLEMRAVSVASRSSVAHCRGVLVIAPGPDRYPHAHAQNSTFRRYFAIADAAYRPLPAASTLGARAVTWEQVAEIVASKPTLRPVAEYLGWRLRLLD